MPELFQNVEDIKKAIASFRNDTNFLSLKARWEKDFRLWSLQPYDAGAGYYSYTTNSPRVFSDKVVSLLNDSALLVSIPDDLLLGEDELEVASNVERFWYGSLNMNDEKLLLLPKKPTIRSLMSWYSAVRGAFGTRVYVYKDDHGKTQPDIKIWDIYSMAYGADNDGVIWATRLFKMTKEQAEKEYGNIIGKYKQGATIDGVEYWDREKYCLIIEGQLTDKGFIKHGLKYCPVAIIGVGSTPEVWQDDAVETTSHVGESVLAPARDIFPAMSKTFSDLVTMVRRGVKVPMGYWSNSGTKTIDHDIFQVDKAAVVPFQTDDKFLPLLPQTMPPDSTNAINIMMGEMQRATFPHNVYGEIGVRLSGFALNQLRATIMTVVEPCVEAIERAYTIICLWLLEQYTSKSLPPIEVRGRTSKNAAFGYPIAVQIKASDLKGNWHPEVRLEPKLPKDDPEKYQLAQMARDGDVPLLSDKTIKSDILGIRDPDLEDDQIDHEWASRMFLNRLQDAYFRAVELGDMLKAQNYMIELQRYMMQMGYAQAGRGGGGKGATPYQQEAGRAGMLPVRKTGLPSSIMPAEAGGGFPPGAVNAQMPLFQGEV